MSRLLLLASLALTAQEPPPISPIPEKTVQDRHLRELREIFKDDYLSRDTANRRALAQKLLANAAGAEQQYVMLTEARDLAAAAGDLETAFKAISQLETRYALSAAGQKADALAMARKAARTRDELVAIAQVCLDMAREEIGQDEYAAALSAVREAESAARTLRDRELLGEVRELNAEIIAFEKDFKTFQAAELRLSVDPEDTEANLAVGRFYCFCRGAWEKGLPFLAKGSHPGLKAAAAAELAGSKDLDEWLAVGDVWAALSRKEWKKEDKERYRARAEEWYLRALKGAEGLARLSVEKKIRELGPGSGVRYRCVITSTCDNSYELFVNGSKVGGGSNWQEFQTYPLELRSGDVIAIAAKDSESGNRSAGLFCAITTDRHWIPSGTGWTYSLKPVSNWKTSRSMVGWKTISFNNIPSVHKKPPPPGTSGAFFWSNEPASQVSFKLVVPTSWPARK